MLQLGEPDGAMLLRRPGAAMLPQQARPHRRHPAAPGDTSSCRGRCGACRCSSEADDGCGGDFQAEGHAYVRQLAERGWMSRCRSQTRLVPCAACLTLRSLGLYRRARSPGRVRPLQLRTRCTNHIAVRGTLAAVSVGALIMCLFLAAAPIRAAEVLVRYRAEVAGDISGPRGLCSTSRHPHAWCTCSASGPIEPSHAVQRPLEREQAVPLGAVAQGHGRQSWCGRACVLPPQ